jgi:lipoprotein-anchoring transpeptidase ErfK/SrfK
MAARIFRWNSGCTAFFALAAFLTGCSQSKWDDASGRLAGTEFGNHSLAPFIDRAVLDTVNPGNARIEIDLGAQKARLFKGAGSGRELALETPISTGMVGKETPRGQFHILEKLPSKESTLYGIWVDGMTGALVERDGDSRYRPPANRAQFMGSSMPYWLKVTPDGVGMHVGYVSRNPVSHGCIRVPRTAQVLIYEKVSVGTLVTIVL